MFDISISRDHTQIIWKFLECELYTQFPTWLCNLDYKEHSVLDNTDVSYTHTLSIYIRVTVVCKHLKAAVSTLNPIASLKISKSVIELCGYITIGGEMTHSIV